MARRRRYRNKPIAFKRPVHLRGKTKGYYYPRCFAEHKAPRSVVRLFTKWVEEADNTDNGIILINLQHQRIYSNTTTQKAIAWLTKHNLMAKTEVGVGQGKASKYFIRWSFIYDSLTDRQKTINSGEDSEDDFSESLVTSLYYSGKSNKFLTRKSVPQENISWHFEDPFSINDETKSELLTNSAGNSTQNALTAKLNRVKVLALPQHFLKIKNHGRKLLIEKTTRYAMWRLRQYTDNPDVIRAAAKTIRRKLKTGKIFPGPEVNDFIRAICQDDYDGKSTAMIYRMVGQITLINQYAVNLLREMDFEYS